MLTVMVIAIIVFVLSLIVVMINAMVALAPALLIVFLLPIVDFFVIRAIVRAIRKKK